MDFQQLFARVLDTVDQEAYFLPVDAVGAEQRAAIEAIRDAIAGLGRETGPDADAVRALVDRLHAHGHIDAVLRLSSLHVLACHPRVADYEEAARLVGEQEFAALELGGPHLQANLASVDRHRGVLAFLKGHHEVALDYFARALERQRSAENMGNILCTLCAMGELDEARSLLQQVRSTFPAALVDSLDQAIRRDPDLAPLRSEVPHEHH
jgi:tetratricopeptide (TPR) repeat protein